MTAFDKLMEVAGPMDKQATYKANDKATADIVREIFEDGTGANLTKEQFAEEVKKRYAKKHKGGKPNISKEASTVPSVGMPGIEVSPGQLANNIKKFFGFTAGSVPKQNYMPPWKDMQLSTTDQTDIVDRLPDLNDVGKNLPNIQATDPTLEERLYESLGGTSSKENQNADPSMWQQALKWLGKDRQNVLGTGLNVPNWALIAGILGAGGLGALAVNRLSSPNDNNNEDNEKEDMTNQYTNPQLKMAAVLDYLQKQAQAKAMKAQDPTEGPQIPQRPTLNQKSSLQRLLEITRTRGLQNQDFGQHGMSSVKSAGTVEKAKDPDEKGQLEKRPDLTPGSSLQKLLQIVQSNKLKKSAADVTQQANAAKDAINTYKQNPSRETLVALAQALQEVQDKNPSHLNGGYYNVTKDTLSRGNEMLERGNVVRGITNKYLGVPIMALGETLVSPITAIARAIAPSTNIGFDTPSELRSNNPQDTEHNVRAAEELLKLLSTERADPTGQFEGIKNTHKQFSSNTPKAVALTAAALPGGYIPYVAEGIGDILSAPHTALFNASGLNGMSRKDWERSKVK